MGVVVRMTLSMVMAVVMHTIMCICMGMYGISETWLGSDGVVCRRVTATLVKRRRMWKKRERSS